MQTMHSISLDVQCYDREPGCCIVFSCKENEPVRKPRKINAVKIFPTLSLSLS